MRALFRELKLASLAGGTATIDVLDVSYGNVVDGRMEHIADLFLRVTGAPVRVVIGQVGDGEAAEAPISIDHPVTKDPVVQQAKDLFGGTIVNIQKDAAAPQQPERTETSTNDV